MSLLKYVADMFYLLYKTDKENQAYFFTNDIVKIDTHFFLFLNPQIYFILKLF